MSTSLVLAVPAPVWATGGPCRQEVSRLENLKSWAQKSRKLMDQQVEGLRSWNRVHIGWSKRFDQSQFESHRARYLSRLEELYPNGQSVTGTAGVGSRIKVSEKATAEEKLAFLEAVGRHFISESNANPLRAERILDTRLRDFLAKRRFFKKIDALKLNKLKMGELEDLLLDLYTLQNPGRDGLPAKIKALIASILPLTGDFYQSWYRDAVLKRFYLEVMRTGVVEAMGNMNMPIKDPVLSEIRHNRILRQFMGIAISTVINWYVLIPMAYLFGYVHLPEVNLAEWLPLTKALEAEVKKNPDLVREIVTSGFKHEMVEEWVGKYGLRQHGLRSRFDVIYRTLRATYLGLAVPPALYFFIAQFLPFDIPLLDQVMSYWDHLRWQLIPMFLPETGSGQGLEELIKPGDW
ncbi:MAG: hypothetical protein KDD68_18140 [Bdellovibrionales bacterium]|nr:hypothetical protein [Bdellovibrionales bacterium]